MTHGGPTEWLIHPRLYQTLSRERANARYYSLNGSYPLLQEYKRIILKTVGIEQILRDAVKDAVGVKKAYLFGSYAANKMDAMSDIDLLAIGEHDTVELRKKIAVVQKTVDRDINLISMSAAEYEKRKKSDHFLKSIEKSKKIRIV